MPHKHVNRLPSRQVNLQQLVAPRHDTPAAITTTTTVTVTTLSSHCQLIMKRESCCCLARTFGSLFFDWSQCLPWLSLSCSHYLFLLYCSSLFSLLIPPFSNSCCLFFPSTLFSSSFSSFHSLPVSLPLCLSSFFIYIHLTLTMDL